MTDGSFPFSETIEEVDDCGLVDPLPGGEAAVSIVGRKQAAVHGAEPAFGREWLDLKDIERGSGNPSLSQSLDERRLVNQRATRRVDDVCRGSHDRQFGATYQVKRSRIEIAMQRDEIGLLKQRPQRRHT